jgi:hypothetical protein
VHTEHVEQYLPDYLNFKLEESLRPWVENHLETCGSCRSELERLQEAFQHLKAYQTPPPDPGYFASVLPRVRERLEKRNPGSVLAHPLLTRFVLPLGAGALLLFMVFKLPMTLHQPEPDHNPLQPIVRGLDTEELVDIILDQMHHQMIAIQGESEASALLAVPLLQGEHLLSGTENLAMSEEPLLDVVMHETLEQMSSSDIDALVVGLGERNDL